MADPWPKCAYGFDCSHRLELVTRVERQGFEMAGANPFGFDKVGDEQRATQLVADVKIVLSEDDGRNHLNDFLGELVCGAPTEAKPTEIHQVT